MTEAAEWLDELLYTSAMFKVKADIHTGTAMKLDRTAFSH